jgi:mercuric ion binding protein
MTRLISILAISLLAIQLGGAQPKPKAADVETDITVIQVPTVVCNSCVKTITKALKEINGVKTTSIDLKKKTATVAFDSSKVTVAKIEEAISKAGYDANSLKRDPAAYEKLDSCCKIESEL